MFNSARCAAALAIVAVASLPTMACAQQCEDLLLGAALSATGIYASNGNNTKNGYEFAVKKINNAGGVKIGGKCYHLKITYYDDESTPARAAQLVERLINQDKIKFILGPYSSPLAKAVLPVTEKYITPVIDMAAEFARKSGKDPSSIKVAMIFQDDPFSLDVRQGVVDEIKKNKMSAVVDDRMPKDLNDITSFFTKVKALKPDVLIISGHEKGAATATREMGEQKIEVPLIGMTHCESAKIAQDFANIAEGFVCPTQWDETMKASDPLFGTASNYDKEMKAAHPEYKVVPYQTAEASGAIYVWKDAFERAQSLDQEKVREALTKTNMPTFLGPIKFAPDGSNPGKSMTMRQIQGGKYKVVWPREIAANDVVYPRDAHY